MMQVLRTMWNNFVNKSSSSIKYDTIFQLNSIDDALNDVVLVVVVAVGGGSIQFSHNNGILNTHRCAV